MKIFGKEVHAKTKHPIRMLKRKEKHFLTCLLTFLLVCFLLFGCSLDDEKENENTEFIPSGKWESPYDSYTINKNTIEYFMAGSEWEGTVFPDTILKGSIEKAVDFSNNSGVLIIKITEATSNTKNKYTGIYYSEYKTSSIKLSTAIGADYSPVEADSLSAALNIFTVDNVGTHVAMWGVYTK